MKYTLAKRLISCSLIALGLGIGSLTIVANNASATTQSIRNVDEPGRNPYQKTVRLSCSVGGGPCIAEFPVVPAGKRLVIQSVSASFSTTAYPSMTSAYLSSYEGYVVHSLPTIYQGGNTYSGYQFSVNQTVQHYYEAGQLPRLQIFTTGSYLGQALFTISGYMVSLS